jgi:ribosomal RNA-processing protein 8
VINETLYKSDSTEAHRMMQENPAIFCESCINFYVLTTLLKMNMQYHLGFRSQSSSWPTNPIDHYITTISRSPKGTVIADLACGDATLG